MLEAVLGTHVDDRKVLDIIKQLVDREHDLRSREPNGLRDDELKRMHEIEEALDQCWDYLRQRRAAREYGFNAEDVGVRTREVVEDYEQ